MMRPIRVSKVTSRQRVRTGSRTLSNDEWAVVQILNDATDGDIPAVRKLVRKLRKSGKGVVETLAAINHPQFRGCGPLHMAAWAGGLEMCRFLVEELRLNVDAPGDDGVTPLSYAISGCGSTSVVRFLLDHGAKPNKTDTKGFTALHIASLTVTDTCEIAELLLSRGVYVDPLCEYGTPLYVAAQGGNYSLQYG